MAKAGTSSTVVERGSARSADTRRQLVRAAVESLKTEGYAGASARSIAERAGVNQGLVFYHFGSVANLLLAALDAVSAERMVRYQAAAEGATSPTELVDVATVHLPRGPRRRLRHRARRDDRGRIVDAGARPGGVCPHRSVVRLCPTRHRALSWRDPARFDPALDGRRLRRGGAVSRARDAEPPHGRPRARPGPVLARRATRRAPGGTERTFTKGGTMTRTISARRPPG